MKKRPCWAVELLFTEGGNTAIDVARTVKRLGSEPIVVYRRTRDRAPAHAFEIQEAIEEGVFHEMAVDDF